MTRCVFLLALLAAPGVLHAQDATAKYWVFFTDKGGATEAAPVSEQAEARRALRGRADRPRGVDVAVAPDYVAAVAALGGTPEVTSRWLNAVSATLTPPQREAVSALPFVRAVRPVARVRRMEEPTFTPLASPVPVSAGGYNFGASATQLALVNADRTLNAGYTGAGVRLGFLDTLFDFDHPALVHIPNDGRLLGVMDFTGQVQTSYHGLNTTSVAMGFAEGQLIGPAFGAEVMAATTEYAPTETHAEEDYFIAGLEWLEAGGIDVVSISLGYSTFDPGEGDYTYEDMDGDTTPFTIAVDQAAALGVVVVTSAGNEGNGPWHYITAPADADSVIAVGAVDAGGNHASFSGYGPTFDGRTKPDVSAMGVDVRIASSGGGYAFSNGTSFSAPMVAGIACQILEAHPDLDPIAVRDRLRETASLAASPNNALGWGIVDAEAAILSSVAAEPGAEGAAPWRLYPSVARAGEGIAAEVNATAPGALTLTLVDELGRAVATLYRGPVAAGAERLRLTAPDLPGGLYFVRAAGPGVSGTARLVIVR